MEESLREALDAVIEGHGVRRGTHGLVVEGKDASGAFRERLAAMGYREVSVGEAEVHLDRRVPAFLVRGGEAMFGWVFFERFDEKRRRKMFGSAEKKNSGSWKVVLEEKDPTPIWVKEGEEEDYDPGSFYGE